MPQTARVPINEKTLRWAREQSRVDRDDLAKHLLLRPARWRIDKIGMSIQYVADFTRLFAERLITKNPNEIGRAHV